MTLRAYLKSHAETRFAYGTHDCALFAAGWVQLATGRDLTRAIRYSTRTEGLAALAALGFADHVALAEADLPTIPVAFAQRGDLAVLMRRGQRVLGIVLGERVVAPVLPRGLRQVDLTEAVSALAVRP